MARLSTAEAFLPAALDALSAFPITPGEVTLAAYSENITYKVTEAIHGGVYALRLHRPGYNTLAELQAEHAWLQALSAAGMNVPSLIPTRDGGTHADVFIGHLGERRLASLTRWIHGRLLSTVLAESTDPGIVAGYWSQLGEITARMHEQAIAWRPPAAFERRCLDLEALIGEHAVWGRFEHHPALSPDERKTLLRTRTRIGEALGALAPSATNFSLIHADIYPENVIVNGERLGIVDFDDAGFGWHLYDIAVGLFYLHAGPDSARMQAAYLRGYSSVRPLDDAQLALLPYFRLTRGLMLIGWFQARPKLDGSPAFLRLKHQVLAQCTLVD